MKKKYLMIPAMLILMIFIMGDASSCSTQTVATTPNSYQNDSAVLETTQEKMQKAVPAPKLVTSAERTNISNRAKLFDNENLTTYIYLISYGKVMAFYPVKGKVSSLNSYLTPMDKLVKADGSQCDITMSEGGDSSNSWEPCYTVQSSDIDGSYGTNANGIFFFTADTGSYIEWSGDYLMASQPLSLSTPPELVREIK